jgi:M6 family metalloprotease-like protein
MKPIDVRPLRILLCIGLAAPLMGIRGADASPAPAPGQNFPETFIEYKKAHPEKFKVGGGWRNSVQRARGARRDFLIEEAAEKAGRRGSGSTTKGASLAVEATALPAAAVVTGTFQIPVILAEYANVAAPYTPATLDTVLFGANPTGSLTDYYTEVSYGNITVTGTVFDWATLPSNDTVYEGGQNGLPPRGQTGQLIEDALDDVDGGTDFGQFDNDGPDGTPNSGDDDGFVDFVAFVHPEIGGECGGTGIWSHRWNYRFWANSGGSPYTTDDARSGGGFIQIDDYVIQPALNCSGGTIEIGVFAHEFGHAFGIPDLYDTDQAPNDSAGLGNWSLMASGNWNTPSRPAHWDAWSKSQLGWLTPTLLTSQSLGQAIDRVEDNPTAIQVVTGNGKYFLIENRQVVGFDQNLASCGLLIYDIDESIIASRRQSNQVNSVHNCGSFQQNAPDHAGIALEQADALCQLEGNVNRGNAGDPFPGGTNNQTFDCQRSVGP